MFAFDNGQSESEIPGGEVAGGGAADGPALVEGDGGGRLQSLLQVQLQLEGLLGRTQVQADNGAVRSGVNQGRIATVTTSVGKVKGNGRALVIDRHLARCVPLLSLQAVREDRMNN